MARADTPAAISGMPIFNYLSEEMIAVAKWVSLKTFGILLDHKL
jgi:hypothetical protein